MSIVLKVRRARDVIRRGLITLARLDVTLDDLKIEQGRLATAINESKTSTNLTEYEFRVFSQFGDDGIIQKIVSSIEIANKTFIEFGVEDFRESNCRFLMQKDNWSGLVIDGMKKNIAKIHRSDYFWRHDLQAIHSFITRDNIESTLESSKLDYDLGILSVDIDGMDYFVLEAITSYKPRVLIVEYNSLFGPERAITVPYDPFFQRSKRHYSHLYFGASLAAFAHLAGRRGYALVGANSAGVNAFFVRRELLTDPLSEVPVAAAYVQSRFREGRRPDGSLSLLPFAERYEQVRGLPVLDVVTGAEETL